MRRAGGLRPPSVPRAGRTRPRRRGVLRPALPRGARPAGAADQGAQPRPVPRAGPVPHSAAERDQDADRPARTADDVDGRFPRTEDVQPARGPAARRPARRLRRRPRQPEPRHRPVDDRRAGPAGGGDRAPSDHPGPGPRRGRRAVVAKAVGAPLVRVRGDAAEGRPADPRAADGLVDVGRRHRRRLRGVVRPTARGAAGGGHRAVQARRAPGAQPDHRDRQRRRAAEGRQPPAARRRAASGGTRPRTAAGRQARTQRTDREAHRRAGHLRHRAQLERALRLRAGRPARIGRNRLHSFAVRRFLAARRGGDGQRYADRRQPRRRAARGGRRRRRMRAAGPAGRRRRADPVLGELLDSPLELQRLGANGRQRALDVFSWESVAAQTVAVYERACERVATC